MFIFMFCRNLFHNAFSQVLLYLVTGLCHFVTVLEYFYIRNDENDFIIAFTSFLSTCSSCYSSLSFTYLPTLIHPYFSLLSLTCYINPRLFIGLLLIMVNKFRIFQDNIYSLMFENLNVSSFYAIT